MVIYSRGGKYMKNNIVKLIIGLFATGTVATTSAVITTKVVENKENKMVEKQNNNIINQNISEEKEENGIENQPEEIIENEVIKNTQQQVTASNDYDNKSSINSNLDNESNNISGERTENQKILSEYNKAKQEAWKQGEDLYFNEFANEYNKQQTQPTSSTEPSPEVVENN